VEAAAALGFLGPKLLVREVVAFHEQKLRRREGARQQTWNGRGKQEGENGGLEVHESYFGNAIGGWYDC